VNDLLESTRQMYSVRFKNYRIRDEIRMRSTEHIVCFAREIRQVLSNLIANAIDAMSSKGGRLLLRTPEATDLRRNTKGILVTVADTGHGMSTDTLEGVYRAFFTTKGINGTGLGMWISAEIVERHRGTLRVRSRQGTASRYGLSCSSRIRVLQAREACNFPDNHLGH
jgi:two-component system sporulation sensor kinase C